MFSFLNLEIALSFIPEISTPSSRMLVWFFSVSDALSKLPKNLQKGSFPRSRRAHNRNDLGSSNLQVYSFQDLQIAVIFIYVSCFNHSSRAKYR